ncbi:MAG: PIG-L family deacetylase [Nitrospira sp.]
MSLVMVPANLQRIMVVSPHCDDAVFGCGMLLDASPGAIVVTIFGGSPGKQPLTEWDPASGFRQGDDVMAIRCHEDRQALARLSASPIWLPFHDDQYRMPVSYDDLRNSIRGLLHQVRPHAVFVPWGLFHHDHRLASDICLDLRHEVPAPWFLYEEAFYRRIPEELSARVALLRLRGIRARPVAMGHAGSPERKREAVVCYQSQLSALATPGRPGIADVFEPERVWLVHP